MNRWRVIHSQNGYSIALYRTKWWTPLAEWTLDHACSLTGHRLCSGLRSDIFNRIPVGRPRYEPDPFGTDEPWLENSVNGAIFRLNMWLWNLIWRREQLINEVDRFPVTDDEAADLWPQYAPNVES